MAKRVTKAQLQEQVEALRNELFQWNNAAIFASISLKEADPYSAKQLQELVNNSSVKDWVKDFFGGKAGVK